MSLFGEKKETRKFETEIRNAVRAIAGLYSGRQTAQYRKGERIAKGFTATKPGYLSPYAQAQYASDIENIQNTYRGLREAGLASLNRSGFGRAPAGFRGSYEATSDRALEESSSDAYRSALQKTEDELWKVLGYRERQQDRYNPLPAFGMSSDMNIARSQMGTTLGDIMQGISTGAGLVSSFAIPGIQGLSSGLGRLIRPSSSTYSGPFGPYKWGG